MVSTRSHPREFPEPESSPTKDQSPSKRTRREIAVPNDIVPEKQAVSIQRDGRISEAKRISTTPVRSGSWAHTPSNATLIWLTVSLPLVIWDTGYVLLRPHSMPGGSLHWPVWAPYELYGKVDYVYGWKAFNAQEGFTGAQGLLNAIETSMYFYYLYVLYTYGRQSSAPGRGAPAPAKIGFLGQQRFVDGAMGAVAVLVAYSAALMTLSKTVLYWLNEYYSGFANIGHNSTADLLFLWIIPNGAWIILPAYMIYVMGAEITQGLTLAAGGAVTSPEDTSLMKME